MAQLIDAVDKRRTIKPSDCKQLPVYINDEEVHFISHLLATDLNYLIKPMRKMALS